MAGDIRQKIADDWREHVYYEDAEQWTDAFWQDGTVFRSYFDYLNPRRLIELACGHGRHSERAASLAETLTLIDVNNENIDACRIRLNNHQNIKFIVNNGSDLKQLEDSSYTAFFCYDAMVHFEADDVISYLSEISRVLEPGGRAVIHYSNMNWLPGSVYGDAPHMRNFFSEAMMIHFAQRRGFSILKHSTIDWGHEPTFYSLDAIILLEKKAE